jgi:hypothetical protein
VTGVQTCALPIFTESITGYVNGEDASSAGVTGSATGSSAATASSGVGPYTITGSTGTLAAANYDFTAANGTLTVNKAHLTVTANNQTRLYGQANPAFTETITGFVNGENATMAGITGSAWGNSAATAWSSVGSYTINGNIGSLSAANYDFTAADGTLTINSSASRDGAIVPTVDNTRSPFNYLGSPEVIRVLASGIFLPEGAE